MLEITSATKDRVDIHINGKITSAQMAIALDELIEASHSIENGKMLYTIENIQMPELSAIAVEFTRLPKLFGLLVKFDYCAVIAEASWVRTLAEIEGALFPGLEIKSFEVGEEDKAEKWLSSK